MKSWLTKIITLIAVTFMAGCQMSVANQTGNTGNSTIIAGNSNSAINTNQRNITANSGSIKAEKQAEGIEITIQSQSKTNCLTSGVQAEINFTLKNKINLKRNNVIFTYYYPKNVTLIPNTLEVKAEPAKKATSEILNDKVVIKIDNLSANEQVNGNLSIKVNPEVQTGEPVKQSISYIDNSMDVPIVRKTEEKIGEPITNTVTKGTPPILTMSNTAININAEYSLAKEGEVYPEDYLEHTLIIKNVGDLPAENTIVKFELPSYVDGKDYVYVEDEGKRIDVDTIMLGTINSGEEINPELIKPHYAIGTQIKKDAPAGEKVNIVIKGQALYAETVSDVIHPDFIIKEAVEKTLSQTTKTIGAEGGDIKLEGKATLGIGENVFSTPTDIMLEERESYFDSRDARRYFKDRDELENSVISKTVIRGVINKRLDDIPQEPDIGISVKIPQELINVLTPDKEIDLWFYFPHSEWEGDNYLGDFPPNLIPLKASYNSESKILSAMLPNTITEGIIHTAFHEISGSIKLEFKIIVVVSGKRQELPIKAENTNPGWGTIVEKGKRDNLQLATDLSLWGCEFFRLYSPFDCCISSSFGWRVHPISKVKSFHEGIDYAIAEGVAIPASGDGTVKNVVKKFPTWLKVGYGNRVEIDHGCGYKTLYGHMLTVDVTEGQAVSKGQTLGTVGSTGHSTGPHLHFELYKNNTQMNPLGNNSPITKAGISPQGLYIQAVATKPFLTPQFVRSTRSDVTQFPFQYQKTIPVGPLAHILDLPSGAQSTITLYLFSSGIASQKITEFTLRLNPMEITSIEPPQASPGEIVKIKGTEFGIAANDNDVIFGNIAQVKALSVNDAGTELTARVPANAPVGTMKVNVEVCSSACVPSNQLDLLIGYGSPIAASCDINLNPANGVFANGADTAEVTALNIKDGQGLLVPDGSFLLFEPVYRSNYSDMGGFQNTTGLYSPIPYPPRSYDGRMVAGKISGGVVKVNYQAPTAGLEFRNPSSIRGINVYAGLPDWHGYIGYVNLILSYNVPIVYTDRVTGITTSASTVPLCHEVYVTVDVTGIKDANGEIVPDGTPIRIDGGTNGSPASDSIRDRYFTNNGSISGTVKISTCNPGTVLGGIWSTPTNWYSATDKLKSLGAWSVVVQ